MAFRILHVMPDLVPYGAERIVANLTMGLDRSRFQSAVVSLFGEKHNTLAGQLQANGVPVFYLGKRPGFDARMYGRLAQVLREFQPHAVHTNNYVLRYTLPPALRHKIPLQLHTLQNVAEHEVDRWGIWLQRWAFRSGRVIPVSIAERVSDSFEKVYGLPRPALVPNAIEVARFANARAHRARWRSAAGFQPGDLLYVCAARFFAQKNHPMLLDAFAAGPAQLPYAKLLLAGDGALRMDLERRAERLGIADKVFFLGRRDDIPELLGAADVFALASRWEGNPLSVMEAMAAGLPVVATDVGGVCELVEHGKNGFVCESGDTRAFASALLEVARDPRKLREFGESAASRAREKFDYSLMVNAYERLYERLLTAAGVARPGVFTPC